MTKNKYLSLFIILLITFIASAIGGFTTSSFKEPWYSEIILPSFNPPSWVFAPVWTTLYVMMSIAIWKIWTVSYDLKILKLYFIHLFFNGTWSVAFFGFHQIGLALINLFIMGRVASCKHIISGFPFLNISCIICGVLIFIYLPLSNVPNTL